MRIEPKRIAIRNLLRLAGLALLLAGSAPTALADRDSSDVVKPPDVSAIPASELERWLRGECRFSGPRTVYEACVRTIASRQPPFDKNKSDHFGELYSPTKYVECRLTNDRAEGKCAKHILWRYENPIFWPNPTVRMPKLPEAPKEDVYRPWMTKQKYFEALCKAEAGEFIYKTVENVEGIYQIRPRARENDQRQEDRYVIEDPYGYEDWEAENAFGAFVKPTRYQFLEVPNSKVELGSARTFQRYYRIGSVEKSEWDVQVVTELQSRYGFVWRGTKRHRDRENNIAGGELLVVDLQTAELLAVSRGFVLGGPIPRSRSEIYWKQGKLCRGDSSRLFRSAEFIERVLRPSKRSGS